MNLINQLSQWHVVLFSITIIPSAEQTFWGGMGGRGEWGALFINCNHMTSRDKHLSMHSLTHGQPFSLLWNAFRCVTFPFVLPATPMTFWLFIKECCIVIDFLSDLCLVRPRVNQIPSYCTKRGGNNKHELMKNACELNKDKWKIVEIDKKGVWVKNSCDKSACELIKWQVKFMGTSQQCLSIHQGIYQFASTVNCC